MNPGQNHNDTVKRYYKAVAARMAPFLVDRSVAVRWADPSVLTRRDLDGPIRIESKADVIEWVEQGVVAFYISSIADSGEVWFSLCLESDSLPFEVVRLTALKLLLVLEDEELDGLMVYDGGNGIELFWTYGVLDPDELGDDLWGFQYRVAAALQERLEKRLEPTPERNRVGRWLGFEGPATRLEGMRISRREGGRRVDPEGEGEDVVVISTRAMAPKGLIRAPYSLNEESGLAAVPVTRSDLYRFDPEIKATPDRVRRLRRRFEVPLNFPKAVIEALELEEV